MLHRDPFALFQIQQTHFLGWGSTNSEEGHKWKLYCKGHEWELYWKAATAIGECGTKAEASYSRLTVCHHEVTEDEGFISTEQWWKTEWRWLAKTAVGKRSIWQLIWASCRQLDWH
ncbi:uncharacterized protein LOC130765322 [Actinidia eriantha]|uniref:uncharacterized protein LOC130765322 n=1 Tax=Actinidia eriantha TaxID=165200 RepID=UPI00258F788B|nr:uncharacterized protein LOC130765322 [Actinidia eriantha]XP_057477703.1 uncharacterized protein LOC130765322 [Actinidia eriantha]XP_057477705.1 uncharacterized protein LOC130765322 [Actinidia eriantha]XP_057477706.1 uncharacterized protein LOC130765322 [Actinidia eriantha]